MGGRYVGIDLHRRRSVIYTMDADGERLGCRYVRTTAAIRAAFGGAVHVLARRAAAASSRWKHRDRPPPAM